MTKTRAGRRTADMLNQRVEEINTNIQQELSQLREACINRGGESSSTPEDRGGESVSTLEELNLKIESFEIKVSAMLNDIKTEINKYAAATWNIEKQQVEIQRKMYTNYIVVHGIKELSNEDPVEIISSMCKSKFKIDINKNDIDSCYRMGRKTTDVKFPRLLAVKFVCQWKRDSVFTSRKFLKGSGVMFTEMLVKSDLNLYKNCCRKYGNRNCWTWKGNVYASLNNTKKIIRSEDELN